MREHYALGIRARPARVEKFRHRIFIHLHEIGASGFRPSQKLIIILPFKPIRLRRTVEQYEFLLKYAFDRDPEVYLRLAKLYQAAGRMKDARRVMAKGRRIFATNAEIHRLYKDVSGQ